MASNVKGNVMKIRVFPDPVLREPVDPVEDFGSDLSKLLADMWATMYVKDGIGLAAPQVGISKSLAVIDYHGERYTLINPEVLDAEGDEEGEEGCLSFPGIFVKVHRPTRIRVRFQDESGDPREMDVHGFLARVFMHEIDHLKGKLLIDHVSPMRRHMITSKLKKRSAEER
ncbi:peptide deformylase [Thermanaerovibrio velox]|nr:peptide deformylase [Thermanaerovibrio velox]